MSPRAGHSASHGGAAAGYASRPGRASLGEAARDRVQRLNPLLGIVREFLFEGNVSYVAMGTQGMNSALCDLQLRGEAHVPIKASYQSGYQETDSYAHMDKN